jgi:hypothetical protein
MQEIFAKDFIAHYLKKNHKILKLPVPLSNFGAK